MFKKRLVSLVLLTVFLFACFETNCVAADSTNFDGVAQITISRATGKFNMTIAANKLRRADSSFPLEAGETVRINAVYSPDSASVDFGLIDEDNVFHYITVTDGNIDTTIEIEARGNYTLAIRNNSSNEVDVSGFVQY